MRMFCCDSDRNVQFYVGDSLIQSRLIDGIFPDINRLIPQEFGFELRIDKTILLMPLIVHLS